MLCQKTAQGLSQPGFLKIKYLACVSSRAVQALRSKSYIYLNNLKFTEVNPKLQSNLQRCSTKGNWRMQSFKREKCFDAGTCENDNNFDKLLQFCSKAILQNLIFLQKVFCCLKDVIFSLDDHTIKYWLVVLIQGTEKKKDFLSNWCFYLNQYYNQNFDFQLKKSESYKQIDYYFWPKVRNNKEEPKVKSYQLSVTLYYSH